MKYISSSLLALAFGFCASSYAAPWGKPHLETLESQAVQAIDQFILQNEQSPLYRLLSDKEQAELRQLMQFSSPKSPSFANMNNKTHALVKILRSSSGRQKIAYASLLLDYSGSDVYNGNAIYLYENILRYDNDGADYAFKQLDKLNLSIGSEQDKKRQKLHRDHDFQLRNISVHNDGEKPEVCVNFNQRVRGEPAQDWKKLLSVTPKANGDWGYRGDKLCFFGDWQTRYQVSVSRQLQNQYQLKLNADKSEITNTGVRPPMLRFATNGSVLDGSDNRYLAIDTANIDSVDVELWQIPANNLSNSRVQDLVQSPREVSSWRLDNTLRREGEKLFTGTFDVAKAPLNQSVTTNVFFDDLLKEQGKPQAGIYVLKASSADDSGNSAQLAFSLSNAGFSAYLTSEGLWAELRDLQTTQPVAGQKVTLYSRNNSILATAQTNAKGVAYFEKPLISGKDGLRADHVISASGSYFAYANIADNPVDLSDKGLSGNLGVAPLRIWLWADRGIYRPNDTANIMWLLKTPDGKAFHSAPVWLQLLRPDGKIMLEKAVSAGDSGAYQFSHYFANNARQGSWTLRLSLGKDGAFLASQAIVVDAIIPQQIEVKIKPLAKPLLVNGTAQLTLQAEWLYGAPAAALSASLSRTLQTATLKQPRWQGWQIGLHDEENISNYQFDNLENTDKNGLANFALKLDNLPLSSKPLELAVSAIVHEPGGQQVIAKQQLPIARQQPYAALKTKDKNSVEMALVDDSGKLQAETAKWQVYRLNYDYYWYRQGGHWHYRHNETRQLAKSGSISLGSEQPTRLELPAEITSGDGVWLLVVRGDSPNVAASIRLRYGQYFSPTDDNAPDRISISSDKQRYADGEVATLHLQAPFDGKASVKLAVNDNIIDNHLLEFRDGKASLKLTWDSSWDGGLWLLANAWNGDAKTQHNRRAVGLHWLGGDLGRYRVDLGMDLPDTTLPNTTLKLPLSIPPQQADTPTWVQVAVVDDGLYRLAKPSFSNPLLKFFAKRQLNLQFFDVWGQIIRQVKGRQAALRSGAGGDESDQLSALKALPELDLQLLTFWAKPVQFDADGKAVVEVDLPQFNGRLRVMAAAWNDRRLGAVEKTVTVKSPLVATLYTPPYLSPKDSSQLRLRLHNTTDKAMTVNSAIVADNINLAQAKTATLKLAPDQESWVERRFEVAEDADKRVQFKVNISGEQHIELQRFADVRPPAYPLKTQQLSTLKAGQESQLKISQDGSTFKLLQRQLFLSMQAPFDPESMVKQLSIYPYGCSEQITSKAANNLLLPILASRYKLDGSSGESTWSNAAEREKYLFAAQSRLANRQSQDGGFSLWGYGDSNVWLSAYVATFLLDAQQANQLGSNIMLERTLAYLRSAVMANLGDEASQAYAYYALARAGAPVQGATMRFAEGLLAKDKPPMLSTPTLHTVSALVAQGEMDLAQRLLSTANTQGIDNNAYDSYAHYGAGLRNYTQSLNVLYALQKQLQQLGVAGGMKTTTAQVIDKLWMPLQQALANRHYYSTQELHHLSALAANLPPANSNSGSIVIDGKPLTFTDNKTLQLDNSQAVKVKNTGDTTLYLSQSNWLVPENDQITENGYSIVMRYENEQGDLIDISQLQPNQQFFAIAKVTMTRRHNADIMFVYPLPAGLSVMPAKEDFAYGSSRPWAKQLLPPTFSEDRDDRHIAAFNAGNSDKDTVFTHVFMLRAARKGTWHAPAYSIEEMYQPEYRALYPSPTVTVQ